jgi:hypothetical protein
MRTVSTRLIVTTTPLLLCLALAAAIGARPAAQGSVPASDVFPVVLKASEYLAGYVKALSSVVSEERYEQILRRTGDRQTAGMTLGRTLVSDYLLVSIAGTSEWMAFRDVYSVDGVPVRDRSDRLLKLFVEAPPDAYKQALRIREESSRYNIGAGMRDINVPTFALQVLGGEWRGGFTFKLRGHERIGDVDTVVVEYNETATPTLVVGRDGENVPSRGRLWIDPEDGRILRTLFETRPGLGQNTLEARFRDEPKLGLLVPEEMIERRKAGAETLEGKAVYTNFRRFRVDTSIEIK